MGWPMNVGHLLQTTTTLIQFLAAKQPFPIWSGLPYGKYTDATTRLKYKFKFNSVSHSVTCKHETERERVQMLLDYGESSFASSTMQDQSVHVVLSLDVGLHHTFKAHLGMVPWAVMFQLNIVAFQFHGLIPHPLDWTSLGWYCLPSQLFRLPFVNKYFGRLLECYCAFHCQATSTLLTSQYFLLWCQMCFLSVSVLHSFVCWPTSHVRCLPRDLRFLGVVVTHA